jgi:hypothetical protein
MNVRVHTPDFTQHDYLYVDRVRYHWDGGVVLEDGNCEEIAVFNAHQVTSIEIRL